MSDTAQSLPEPTAIEFPSGFGAWRRRLYRHLEPSAWPRQGLSALNKAVIGLILLAVAFAVLESEDALLAANRSVFLWTEIGLACLFLVEYAARVWVAAENPAYGPGWRGRLRYVVSPGALIDLAALSPLLLSMVGSEAFLLRLLRLVRILKLARLGRFSSATRALAEAVSLRRYEFAMSLAVALVLLLVSSTLLYVVEGGLQPEAFGSIPRAMWWSVATLTTVGYGDVAPVTAIGRILAGMTAIAGIGLIAMPTGILAAAFSEVVQRRNREAEQGSIHES